MTGQRMSGNWSVGRNPFRWSEYDALPPAVRRVMMYAYTTLGTRRAAMNLAAGKSVDEVCAIERGVALGVTRREVRAAYGPAHPFLEKGHA